MSLPEVFLRHLCPTRPGVPNGLRPAPAKGRAPLPFAPPQTRTAGFTLTEVLVVIAILVVLAALLFSGIRSATSSAHRVTCMDNLRQIGVGLGSFVAENNRYPSDQRYEGDDDLVFDREILLQLEAPHADLIEEQSRPLSTRSMPRLASTAKLFCCPADKLERSKGRFKRSYALVPWVNNLTTFQGDIPRGWSDLEPNRGVSPAIVDSPATSAVIVEWHSGTDSIENCLGHGSHQYHDRGGEVSDRPDRQKLHSGKQNVLFADGHVELVPLMSSKEFTSKYWPLDTRFNPSQP